MYCGTKREKTGHEPIANCVCSETPSVSQEGASSLSQEAGTSLSDGKAQEAEMSSLTAVNLQKQTSQL